MARRKCSIRYLGTISLVQLRKISEGRVILWEPVSLGNVVENDFIARGILLVVLHFRSLDIESVRRTICRCYLRRAVGLHPEFGAKASGLLSHNIWLVSGDAIRPRDGSRRRVRCLGLAHSQRDCEVTKASTQSFHHMRQRFSGANRRRELHRPVSVLLFSRISFGFCSSSLLPHQSASEAWCARRLIWNAASRCTDCRNDSSPG